MSVADDDWERHAEWWREEFCEGADAEYEQQILPLALAHTAGAERVLDVGAGEGQLTRRLAAAGTRTAVGIDPSVAQLLNAGAHRSPAVFVRGAGERLPFRSASFDAVVCCLVIEHAEDPDALLGEVARVLEPGGRFVLLINHPMFQGTGSGFVDDQILDERYWRVGPYLHESEAVEEVAPGVHLAFKHRPLSRYINPLCDAGMALVHLDEPDPLAEFLAGSVDPALEAAIPRLLVLTLVKLAQPDMGG
jgi:SAM-dependent methyltransferase